MQRFYQYIRPGGSILVTSKRCHQLGYQTSIKGQVTTVATGKAYMNEPTMNNFNNEIRLILQQYLEKFEAHYERVLQDDQYIEALETLMDDYSKIIKSYL